MPEATGYTFGQFLYRYDDQRVGFWDSDLEQCVGYRVEIECWAYQVVKVTPRGAWIRNALHLTNTRGDRFIRWKGRKKYAYPTHAEAWESFLIRKRRRVEYLQEQLDYAQRVQRKAEAKPKPVPPEASDG
jgi:hypothetical protein